jgi:hypothetical protein
VRCTTANVRQIYLCSSTTATWRCCSCDDDRSMCVCVCVCVCVHQQTTTAYSTEVKCTAKICSHVPIIVGSATTTLHTHRMNRQQHCPLPTALPTALPDPWPALPLAWPGLAWPGLAWPGLAWPGLPTAPALHCPCPALPTAHCPLPERGSTRPWWSCCPTSNSSHPNCPAGKQFQSPGQQPLVVIQQKAEGERAACV